jgi:hypothetical protein
MSQVFQVSLKTIMNMMCKIRLFLRLPLEWWKTICHPDHIENKGNMSMTDLGLK